MRRGFMGRKWKVILASAIVAAAGATIPHVALATTPSGQVGTILGRGTTDRALKYSAEGRHRHAKGAREGQGEIRDPEEEGPKDDRQSNRHLQHIDAVRRRSAENHLRAGRFLRLAQPSGRRPRRPSLGHDHAIHDGLRSYDVQRWSDVRRARPRRDYADPQ